MLTFYREYLGDTFIDVLNKAGQHTKRYFIRIDGKIVCTFYSADNFCYFELAEKKISIFKEYIGLFRAKFCAYVEPDGTYFGEFNFPFGEWFGKTKCKLTLSDGGVFNFYQGDNYRNLFRAETWRQYIFYMDNDSINITYSGRLSSTMRNMVDKEQTFRGEIAATNIDNLLPIMMGIFVIEEKFRRIEQRPE